MEFDRLNKMEGERIEIDIISLLELPLYHHTAILDTLPTLSPLEIMNTNNPTRPLMLMGTLRQHTISRMVSNLNIVLI